MVAYKRKRVPASYSLSSKKPKSTAARVAKVGSKTMRVAPSFVKRLKALVSGATKDAPDIFRMSGSYTGDIDMCLTSTTPLTTAATTTGLCTGDSDSCMLNSVRLWGSFQNWAVGDTTPLNNTDRRCRLTVVYYVHPAAIAVAGGDLPPAAEWRSDVVGCDVSERIPWGENTPYQNKFVILSDRKFNLGRNEYTDGGAETNFAVGGKNVHSFDYTVKINKKQIYNTPATSGNPGGHYDQVAAAGGIQEGLLVAYFTCNGATTVQLGSRLRYTML